MTGFAIGDIVSNISKKFMGNNSAIGVDIGTNSIKIVVLKKDGDKIILDNYAIVRTKDDLIDVAKAGIINDFAGVVVREALESIDIRRAELNVAIPSFTSLIVTIEVPNVSEEEVERIIRKEIVKYIPVKIDEVVYDWQIIDETFIQERQKGGRVKSDIGNSGLKQDQTRKAIKVLIIAITKEISQRYVEVLAREKLGLSLLEIDSISLSRALSEGQRDKVSLILDIGHASCNILVSFGGNILLNRTIDVGGDKMTQVIADSMKIDIARAEQLKKEKGLKFDGSDGVRNALATVVGVIVSEVKKTIELFEKDFMELKVERILLSGGAASMIGLKEFIYDGVGIEAVIGNALQGISFQSDAKSALLKNAASLSIAIGLALAEFKE